MVDIGGRPGLWKRAGQMGVVSGLDWPAFKDLLPEGCNRERVLALARPFEAGLIEGGMEMVKSRPDKE